MVHIISPPHPSFEGTQSDVLFAAGRWNNEPGVDIPALNDKATAHTPHAIVASAALRDLALTDAAVIRIRATGTFLADSPDPRMLFDVAIGPQGSETALRPVGGAIRSDAALILADNGIEVSQPTTGENCLARVPGEPVDWDLDLSVHCLGWDGTGEYDGIARTDSNVRVTGSLKWGRLLEMNAAGGTSPGPLIQARNQTWSPEWWAAPAVPYEIGYEVVHHGRKYVSLWDVPSVDLGTARTSATYLDNWATYEPGAAREWRVHWFPVVEEAPIDFLGNVDLLDRDMWVHLRMGGPYQMDLSRDVQPWQNASGFYFAAGGFSPENSVVSHSNAWFAPRVDHFATASIEPDLGTPGAEWERYWRVMSPLRQDRMAMSSAVITLHGGRVGVADSVPMQG